MSSFTNLLGRTCAWGSNQCEIVGVDMSRISDVQVLLLCKSGECRGMIVTESVNNIRFPENDTKPYCLHIISTERDGHKNVIGCIKVIRSYLGLGLKDAKNVADGVTDWKGMISDATVNAMSKAFNEAGYIAFSFKEIKE